MAATRSSVGEFAERLNAIGCVLVCIGSDTSPLYNALATTSTFRSPSSWSNPQIDRLEFRTGLSQPDHPVSTPPTDEGLGPEATQMERLRQEAVFIAVLQKRDDGAAFLDKITVGRARNHDLVLRDPSVSKFHAAFQRQSDGSIRLQDMGSKNCTYINGQKLQGSARIHPGDSLAFGSVEGVFCSPAGLWRFLR